MFTVPTYNPEYYSRCTGKRSDKGRLSELSYSAPDKLPPIGYRPMLINQGEKHFELPHYYHTDSNLLPVIVGELTKWIKQRIVTVEVFNIQPDECVLPMLLEETKPRLWLVI